MTGIGIIGTGYWGKNHVRNYKNLLKTKKIDYLKIYDKNKNRAEEISEIYSIEYVEDLAEILNDKNINAVVIATPSSSHYDLSKRFLTHKKDVFVEKPMTLNSKRALELVNLAEKNKRILMVGHLFRYHPIVKHIKKRIDIGEFGNIEMIISFRFALNAPRKDMGVILALAVHDLDLSCYLLNKKQPKSILVDNSKFHQDKVIEMTNISLDFDNDTKAYMMESWNVPVYGKKRELIIIGSEKSAIIDYLNPSEYYIFDSKINKKIVEDKIILEKEDENIIKITIDYKEPLEQEILHFLNCVNERKKPNSDGEIGYNAVKMCEKAFESAEKNRRIFF